MNLSGDHDKTYEWNENQRNSISSAKRLNPMNFSSGSARSAGAYSRYDDLDFLQSLHEARKKKEYELDLLASKISSPEAESALKSGECLFISTVLVLVDEELRDRVMLVLPAAILFLRHSSSSPVADTFDLDFKISLAPISTHSQLRKVTDLDTVNSQYGGRICCLTSLLLVDFVSYDIRIVSDICIFIKVSRFIKGFT